MSLHSWLRNLHSALAPRPGQRQHARRGPKRGPTRRPDVETLEDRRVPAFLAPVDYAAYPYSHNFAMKAGDFNGDAILDLATVGQGGGIAVLPGNPDGTFQPARYSEAGTFAAEPVLVVGDFNEDGKLDLATNSNFDLEYQDSVDDVAVLLGNGDGTFVSVHLGTNLAAYAVGTGDVNGDGHADLGVYSWHDDTLRVLLGRGDGTFAAPTTFDGSYSESFSWSEPNASLAAADFNADGNLDRADFGGPGLGISLGDGAGSFAPPIWTPVGSYQYSLVVADFNSDGRPDAAVTLSSGAPEDVVRVLLNDGVWPDLSLPWITISSDYLTEGNSGTRAATVTVTLSAPSDQPVTAQYATADGTATAGSDYQAASGTLTFAPGETVKTISVAVLGDTQVEPDEFFRVFLSFPSGANIAYGEGGVTILNDDVAPPPEIRISDVSVTEGNGGTRNAVFTISLSTPPSQSVTVTYATADGSATAGSDYQARSGTLTIPAGQTTGTITVPIIGDRLPEPNEAFAVNLSSPTNATIADGQGVATILDDEPRISISDVTKAEGKKGQTTLFTFTVTLSAPYDQAVTMSFRTVNGTATTGDGDYVAKTGTLTFAPGETTKTITIEVKGDSKKEADETFYLDLFGNSSNSLFTKSRGTGWILNDD
jgi:hypothetical protein